MKDHYQYIHFVKVAEKPKTAVYHCLNNSTDDKLGEVYWYPAWRQYCYFPSAYAVYSAGCLKDIQDFIEQLERARVGAK